MTEPGVSFPFFSRGYDLSPDFPNLSDLPPFFCSKFFSLLIPIFPTMVTPIPHSLLSLLFPFCYVV